MNFEHRGSLDEVPSDWLLLGTDTDEDGRLTALYLDARGRPNRVVFKD